MFSAIRVFKKISTNSALVWCRRPVRLQSHTRNGIRASTLPLVKSDKEIDSLKHRIASLEKDVELEKKNVDIVQHRLGKDFEKAIGIKNVEIERKNVEIERKTIQLAGANHQLLLLKNFLYPRCVMELFEEKRLLLLKGAIPSISRREKWQLIVENDKEVKDAIVKYVFNHPIDEVASSLYKELSNAIHNAYTHGEEVIIDGNLIGEDEVNLFSLLYELYPLPLEKLTIKPKVS